jgi:hypothetical protein
MIGSTLAANRFAFPLFEVTPRRCICFSFDPLSLTALTIAASSAVLMRALMPSALVLGNGEREA